MAIATVAAALALPGVAAAASVTFENPAPVAISTGSPPTIATPYPSTIGVSGFSGSVEDVDATIKNLQHACDLDVSILLVGPGGERTVLMSGTGSCTSAPGADETLTFDDEALTTVPELCASEVLPSGTYRPTRDTACGSTPTPEAFPPPAPTGPHPLALSVFDGTNPNGNWSLYVIDESPSDAGILAGGWSLTITAAADSTPPETTIAKGPKNTTKKKTATFIFNSSEPGSTFECRLDGNLGFSPCTSPQTVRRIGLGRHTFEVRAKDQAGNIDAAPATDQWRVKKKKKKKKKKAT